MNGLKKMNNCLAIIAGICITFGGVVEAESPIEKKLDYSILHMTKAVEEAEKGNFVLGSPFEECPGKPEVKGFVDNICEHPSFSCRCF